MPGIIVHHNTDLLVKDDMKPIECRIYPFNVDKRPDMHVKAIDDIPNLVPGNLVINGVCHPITDMITGDLTPVPGYRYVGCYLHNGIRPVSSGIKRTILNLTLFEDGRLEGTRDRAAEPECIEIAGFRGLFSTRITMTYRDHVVTYSSTTQSHIASYNTPGVVYALCDGHRLLWVRVDGALMVRSVTDNQESEDMAYPIHQYGRVRELGYIGDTTIENVWAFLVIFQLGSEFHTYVINRRLDIELISTDVLSASRCHRVVYPMINKSKSARR